jgi:acetyl-CoA synthetase
VRSRALYRHDQLARVFAPRSIAVVGASPSPTSFGRRTMENLATFPGALYPVNGKYRDLAGRPCFASLADLPESPDCVVVAAPRDAVEAVVLEAADAGGGGVLIFASGYAETGEPQHRALQDRLAAIAAERGIPVIGPNCLGIINFARGACMTFGVPARPRPPNGASVGLVSQSGALAFALAQAMEAGTSISHVLMSGNACDVDIADQVSFLAHDGDCRAIACLFEGMSDPRRFMQAAGIARAAGKPLIVHKSATGAHGAAAAMSHTGSLAGSAQAYRAMFDQAGVVAVDSFEALVETAAFFAKAPAPAARGVAALSISGGAGILAADAAERRGIAMPQPADETRAALAHVIPSFGSTGNPTDLTAQAVNDPAALAACADALLADPRYGALVVGFTSATGQSATRVPLYAEAARRAGKPVCVVWLSQWQVGPGSREVESDPHIAMFRSMDRCFAALAAWHRRAGRLNEPLGAPGRLSAPDDRAVATLLRGGAGGVIAEREAKAVLRQYGVPVVEERLAQSVRDAADAAAELGYPVALKVESPDIPHKTEAGVVRLGIADEPGLREAYDAVLANARAAGPAPRIAGVLVQPMVKGDVEIIVGGRVDPQFGPLVLVGTGGIMVELLKDATVSLAPVGVERARMMLLGLKGAALLRGFRGRPPVDIDALAQAVARISEFIHDHADRVMELDVNPILCSGSGVVAVDGLVSLRRQSAGRYPFS